MAKKIMIQGTMSNSGKSFVAAALCRILRQDGYSVAPFKSQNMALNSYITKDGLEIGRAQAMQAEAAGIAPTVDMNPILLKPTSQMGSQVIVNGEVFGNLKAMDYYRRKTEFIPAVREAFERLESQFDAIVLEGAGSPAEINLRDNDIVNMGMAKIANAPVLLWEILTGAACLHHYMEPSVCWSRRSGPASRVSSSINSVVMLRFWSRDSA